MRILHVIDTLVTGGTSIFLCNLIKQWKEMSPHDEHQIIYLRNSETVDFFKAINVHPIRLRSIIPRYHIDHLPQLIWHGIRYKPDIIHTILPDSCYTGALLGAMLNVPIVWGIHGDIHRAGRYHKLTMLLTRPFVDKCVGVSRFVKKQMESSFLKQKTTVINNGIDFTPFKEMTPKKRSDIFHIGTVARLDPEKTHHVLIDAFAMLTHRFPEQKFHLTLVGKGSEREKLEKLVTSYGLTKQVTFAGYQNPSYPFYPTFDCFVLPSETEGLALALLEAMAAGCPLICTHPNDEHDAIIDGENGFIAPLHDSRALANALQKLVEDPEMGQRMGHINRQRSHDTFSLEGMSKQYVTLFTDVVAQR